MKNIVYCIILLCLIKIIINQCYMENPSSADTCNDRKRDGYKCCYIEYKNNRMSNYSTLCVEVIKDDIKSGHHEATIILIEGGNYTGSDWNETIMEKFRDYSTVSEFDCKGKYLSEVFIFVSFLLVIFLI